MARFLELLDTFDWAGRFLAESGTTVDTRYAKLKLTPDSCLEPVEPVADLFRNMDLVCSQEMLDSLDRIEFEIGGLTFDRVHLGDARCSFLNDIYGRKVETLSDGRVRFPLFVCGTTHNCMMSFPEHHQIRLALLRKRDGRFVRHEGECEVWASCYYNVKRSVLADRRQMIGQQTQFTGVEYVKPTGTQVVKLLFGKPVFCIAFHFGEHHAAICARGVGVKLSCVEYDEGKSKKRVWFQGPISKLRQGADYVMYCFQPEIAPVVKPEKLVDMSRVDHIYLTFEFPDSPYDAAEQVPVYAFAHVYDIPTFINGMAGLRFTK